MTKALNQCLTVKLDNHFLIEESRILKKLKTENSSSENMSEAFHIGFYSKRQLKKPFNLIPES